MKFRIDNFLFSNIGDNYQINKSLESFSNGGLFGQGIGNGIVSKNLPDAHSDFIYALIGEEFGFVNIPGFSFLCNHLCKNIYYITNNQKSFYSQFFNRFRKYFNFSNHN